MIFFNNFSIKKLKKCRRLQLSSNKLLIYLIVFILTGCLNDDLKYFHNYYFNVNYWRIGSTVFGLEKSKFIYFKLDWVCLTFILRLHAVYTLVNMSVHFLMKINFNKWPAD
jgi:hypothetical protein